MKEFQFISSDAVEIKKELKTAYEEIMNVKIADGDPIEDFLDWTTYVFANLRNYMNYIGKMNLLKYSEGKFLEELGEIVDVTRLQDTKAECFMKYTFSKTFAESIVIPKGHKTTNGNLYFETTEINYLKIGERTVTVKVAAVDPGEKSNNIAIGEIGTIVDDIPYLLSVTNITKTSGGANREDDENFRQRIRLKPRAFSVAGPAEAYRYHTMATHPEIVDVYVFSDKAHPGTVKVIPLMENGNLPAEEILEKIKLALEDKVRPLTDKVEVESPKESRYDVQAKYWISKGEDIILTKNKIQVALQEYIRWQKSKLGRDINPSKLTQMLLEAGAKRVQFENFVFTKIEKDTVAKERTVNLLYQGEEDE